MSQSIPAGLTREHVLRTLSDLDAGIDHPFGKPIGYELIHEGKRYAPKAVIGLACRYSIGRVLQPEEFSGGEANFVLRKLGFSVIQKGDEELLRSTADVDLPQSENGLPLQETIPVDPQQFAQGGRITPVGLAAFAFFRLNEDDFVTAIVPQHSNPPVIEATDFDDGNEGLLLLNTHRCVS
ncbi:MAG TPA: hypothetical protein VNQ76_13670 [Planctomicrobium sp.]|nr:hypothetical protein [Planctomicrobium sp.]